MENVLLSRGFPRTRQHARVRGYQGNWAVPELAERRSSSRFVRLLVDLRESQSLNFQPQRPPLLFPRAMGRVSGLVPSRFLTLLAHLVVVITLFWSRVRPTAALRPPPFPSRSRPRPTLPLSQCLTHLGFLVFRRP